jgi:adenylylsulfate kinase
MKMTNKENHNNLTWYKKYINRDQRERLHGHKGVAIWFTGLSASGKSTIAHLVEKRLYQQGCTTYSLDGDNVRYGLCSDLSFSPEDRKENVRRISEMVKLFVDAGLIVLTAFISPFKKDREKVKTLLGQENIIEVYIDCPVDVCAQRDKKGIYEKAKAGIIKEFTGISSPYEPPDRPDLIIHSDQMKADEAAQKVMEVIQSRGILNA